MRSVKRHSQNCWGSFANSFFHTKNIQSCFPAIFLAFVTLGFAAPVSAAPEYLVRNAECAGDLANAGTWNCRANDVVLAGVVFIEYANPNLETEGCIIGETVEVNFATLSFDVNSNGGRNDAIIWISESQDVDPRQNSAANSGGQCVATTMPAPYDNNPFGEDGDNDSCAGIVNAVTETIERTITNFSFECQDNDGNGTADVNILITWDGDGQCDANGFTVPNQKPKCDYTPAFGARIPIVTPALDTVKELTSNADEDASGTVSAGDTLTYTVTVTSTGTATLNNVVVTDDLITPTGGTTPCATLAPAATCTLVGTYVVTQTDVDTGSITNTGTGDSDDTDPAVDDTLVTQVSGNPPPVVAPSVSIPTLDWRGLLALIMIMLFTGLYLRPGVMRR
jgi:uncharacterized repeat protein (TIGR01451 family)